VQSMPWYMNPWIVSSVTGLIYSLLAGLILWRMLPKSPSAAAIAAAMTASDADRVVRVRDVCHELMDYVDDVRRKITAAQSDLSGNKIVLTEAIRDKLAGVHDTWVKGDYGTKLTVLNYSQLAREFEKWVSDCAHAAGAIWAAEARSRQLRKENNVGDEAMLQLRGQHSDKLSGLNNTGGQLHDAVEFLLAKL
jgi:hypothetical protein